MSKIFFRLNLVRNSLWRRAASFTSYSELKSLTPYEILELPRTCTANDIKRKYIELVKKHHPDKMKNASQLAPTESPPEINKHNEEYFRLLLAANALLSDKRRREEYDRFGIHWNQPSHPTHPSPQNWSQARYPTYSRSRRSAGMGSWEEYYYNSYDYMNDQNASNKNRKFDDEGMLVFAGILSILVIINIYSNYRNGKFYREARSAAIGRAEDNFDYYSTGMADLSKDDRISRFLILREQSKQVPTQQKPSSLPPPERALPAPTMPTPSS